MKKPRQTSEPPWAYTGGVVLPDGKILDLVRDPKDGLARLVSYDTSSRSLNFPICAAEGTQHLWALEKPQNWLRAVRFPLTVNPDSELSPIYQHCMDMFLPLGASVASLLAASAVSTWFSDCVQEPLRLFVSGSEAQSVLETLAKVCRRGVLLQASSCGSYPELLRPTLLVRFDSPRLAYRFLSPGSGSSLQWRGANIFDGRTARVAGYSDDAKPMKGVLNITVDSALPPSLVDVDQLQADLMGFRLKTMNKLAENPEIADPILRTLLAPFKRDEPLVERITEAYADLCQPVHDDVMEEEHAAIVETLSEFQREARHSVHVAEIAREAERRLASTGTYTPPSPRATGEVLRRLGIETERLGATGRGIKFNAKNVARLKELLSASRTASGIGDD